MHCTNCGSVLDPSAKFCPACGYAVSGLGSSSQPTDPAPVRLVRPRSQKKIAGVCAGIARYLNWDVTLVRVLWILLVFGAGNRHHSLYNRLDCNSAWRLNCNL